MNLTFTKLLHVRCVIGKYCINDTALYVHNTMYLYAGSVHRNVQMMGSVTYVCLCVRHVLKFVWLYISYK